jgi:hypothetical protein
MTWNQERWSAFPLQDVRRSGSLCDPWFFPEEYDNTKGSSENDKEKEPYGRVSGEEPDPTMLGGRSRLREEIATIGKWHTSR